MSSSAYLTSPPSYCSGEARAETRRGAQGSVDDDASNVDEDEEEEEKGGGGGELPLGRRAGCFGLLRAGALGDESVVAEAVAPAARVAPREEDARDCIVVRFFFRLRREVPDSLFRLARSATTTTTTTSVRASRANPLALSRAPSNPRSLCDMGFLACFCGSR